MSWTQTKDGNGRRGEGEGAGVVWGWRAGPTEIGSVGARGATGIINVGIGGVRVSTGT